MLGGGDTAKMLTGVAGLRRALRSAVGIRRCLTDNVVQHSDVANEAGTDAAMPACASSFLKEMIGRGFANQCTDYAFLDSTLLHSETGNGPMTSAYIGFDATARSLHVGNLIQLMMLRRLRFLQKRRRNRSPGRNGGAWMRTRMRRSVKAP